MNLQFKIENPIKKSFKKSKLIFEFLPQIIVQAKLRCLHDYHQRLLHNTVPLPSGSDIANTLKYFSQTLLSEYKQR
jgi:hypothetical protein